MNQGIVNQLANCFFCKTDYELNKKYPFIKENGYLKCYHCQYLANQLNNQANQEYANQLEAWLLESDYYDSMNEVVE